MNSSAPASLHDSPTILIATLFAARRSGDRALATLVQRRLARLGIDIEFADRPNGKRKAVPDGR